MDKIGMYWSPTTRNRKTGNIPTAFIGATREESKVTCQGCSLLTTSCYAQKGVVAVAHNSLTKRLKRLGAAWYTLEEALKLRSHQAKYVRVSAIGDAARCDAAEVRRQHDFVRGKGMGWLAYTHFYEEAAANGVGDLFTASGNSMEDADRLINLGAKKATAVVPWDFYKNGASHFTPDGRRAVICPALAAHAKGARVSCNECGLCDPEKRGPKVILFPEHGTTVRGKLSKAAKAGAEWAVNLMKPL